MTLMGGKQSSLLMPKHSTAAHRSLSKLQDNVREVAWDIRECKTYELDRSSFEHSFKSGIFNGFLDDIMNVLAETLF